jgi:hypothetical protein
MLLAVLRYHQRPDRRHAEPKENRDQFLFRKLGKLPVLGNDAAGVFKATMHRNLGTQFQRSRTVKYAERGTRSISSATVCFVKHSFVARFAKRVMEKMENDEAVSHLSHNPGYDYEGVIRSFLKQGGPLVLWH